MEIQLRPMSARFHPLIGPVSRRRLSGLRGLGESNVNPTTIWLPGTGAGSGFLSTPGNAATASGGPAVYQAPTAVPVPACASDTQPGGAAFSASCIAQVLAAQQQNMNLNNAANYAVDITNCNNDWAENNAAYTADGIVGPPNTCANDQFGLTPTQTGGYTGSTTGPQPSGAITAPFTPGASTGTATGSTGTNPAFTFTNLTSGNNSSFNVGDRWQIQIIGAAPNSPVSVVGGQSGANTTASMGTTDSGGNFATNGQMTAAEVGPWQETWTVGGRQVASFSFTVSPTGSAAGNSTTATGGSVTGSFSDLLNASTTLGGSSIPDWAIAAAVLVGLFLVMKK